MQSEPQRWFPAKKERKKESLNGGPYASGYKLVQMNQQGRMTNIIDF